MLRGSLFFLSLLFVSAVFAQSAIVDVSLTPAGSFKAKTSEVKGAAIRKGKMVEAQNVVVGLKKLDTGIGVRDQHTRKHLDVDHFPEAILVSAKGENGKGEGVIKIKGIEQKISGTYKIEGSNLVAEFPLKLSDFKISGIKYMGVGVEDEVHLTVSLPLKN